MTVIKMEKPKPKPKCPECSKPVHDDYRPFCSKRCADIDLGRWLKGDYVLPGDTNPASDLGDMGEDNS